MPTGPLAGFSSSAPVNWCGKARWYWDFDCTPASKQISIGSEPNAMTEQRV